MYSAAGVSTCEFFNLGYAYTVVIAFYGVFKGGMMDVKFTKEELLGLNAKLNKIKAPKKK